ncbi:MAG: hypothetical protein DMG95_14315 [Acidobacteria bacterium]|nr:MAG: hypothetical protein DMG95_14315 [Acidobacteriota bacterium]
MSQAAQAITRPPAEVVRETPVSQASNGICYAISGEMNLTASDVDRMVSAVPGSIAGALDRKAYYFVPLTVNQGDQTVIADRYDIALSDSAVCHRNLELGGSHCVFISTRLMDDKFSIAFEFYINVGHAFVERAGVSREFADLVWKQAESGIRGETSDLRERDYPLLAPNALAERLRKVTELFPPNPGFEFAVYYRRRA